MGVLHLAAMPFPSVQGTQAAIRAMLDASHENGRAPELLTYAHGGYELEPEWPHHRIANLSRDRSLRSGPSLRKIVSDAQMVVEAPRLHRLLRPRVTVAHHVEAAAVAVLASVRPFLFLAHTALAPELPFYLPKVRIFDGTLRRLASRFGGALDRGLSQRADAVAAISPWLAEHLRSACDVEVSYVPIPWPVPPAIEPDDRCKARHRLRFAAREPVLLYAGNLDAYQGIDGLVRAFRLVVEQQPDARLLVATSSDPEPLERALHSAGLNQACRFAPISDEPDRRVAHAAADVAWIPRAVEGGLPIKLLDALARGVPSVAVHRAAADLELDRVVTLVADDDPEALAAAAILLLEARDSAPERSRRARAYIREQHSAQRHLVALDAATSEF